MKKSKLFLSIILLSAILIPFVNSSDQYVYDNAKLFIDQTALESKIQYFKDLGYDIRVIIHTEDKVLTTQESNNLFFQDYNLGNVGAPQLNILVVLTKDNNIDIVYVKQKCDFGSKINQLIDSNQFSQYVLGEQYDPAVLLLLDGIKSVLEDQIADPNWCQKKESSGFAYWNYIFIGMSFIIVLAMIFLIIKLRKNKLMNQNYNNKFTRRQF